MNPKPFWPLNHFTVPVVIFFSKAHTRGFRVIATQNEFNSSMSMEKEPAGAFNKAQRLNERLECIPDHRHLQGWPDSVAPERSAGTITGFCRWGHDFVFHERTLTRRAKQGHYAIIGKADVCPANSTSRRLTDREAHCSPSCSRKYFTTAALNSRWKPTLSNPAGVSVQM